MTKVDTWIELSLSDLKSSRLLYENGHYRTSYFHFQQSVEKANKAFALLLGILDESQLQKVRHDQIKIYKSGVTKVESEFHELASFIEKEPTIQEDFILKDFNFLEFRNTLKDSTVQLDKLKDYDLVNISTDVLDELLVEINQIESFHFEFPSDFETKISEVMNKVVEWIRKFDDEMAESVKVGVDNLLSDKQKATEFLEIIKETLVIIVEIAVIHVTLFYCAIVTIQHSSLTRYPVDGESPITTYTENLPLVIKQGKFMDYLEKALIKMRNIEKLEANH